MKIQTELGFTNGRPKSGRLIALVEDNPDDERLTSRALKTFLPGAELHIARDGAEALALLSGENYKPDLILLDIKLPKVSGIEVLKAVRSNALLDGTPIVVFTSSDAPHEIAQCYASGANSYVVKPVDLNEYTELLTRAAEYWLFINR